jgi:NADH-quinone oxidoreductase subunit J
MNLYDIIFCFFAIVTLASAGVVVYSRNIVYSAFSLLFTLMGVAGIYVLLNADFLAVTQMLVYVGGIMVLLLFGVMLTNKVISVDMKTGTLQTYPGSLLAAMVAGALCGVYIITDWTTVLGMPELKGTTAIQGEMFMTSYLLPFEIASVILLVALVGAVMIARKDRDAVEDL